jgi:uncharacterized membrane protein
MSASPVERLSENLVGVVSTAVTGIWLAALFTGQDWWLAALLFGYVVVVPVTAMLFGDEADIEEWWDDADGPGRHAEQSPERTDDRDTTDALDTLRDRYARGELTDEQFERKLEHLLESESLDDVEDRVARERRAADREPREAERE